MCCQFPGVEFYLHSPESESLHQLRQMFPHLYFVFGNAEFSDFIFGKNSGNREKYAVFLSVCSSLLLYHTSINLKRAAVPGHIQLKQINTLSKTPTSFFWAAQGEKVQFRNVEPTDGGRKKLIFYLEGYLNQKFKFSHFVSEGKPSCQWKTKLCQSRHQKLVSNQLYSSCSYTFVSQC